MAIVLESERGAWPGDRRARRLLMLNPSDDLAFDHTVRELSADVTLRPQELERALRRHYPDAVVRGRELSGETLDVWYVYRDGHWTPRSNGTG